MPPIIHLLETNSTNLYLKKLLTTEKPEEGTAVLADFQNFGRGQKGNKWESEKGKNINLSIILYPDFIPANEQFIISQMVSLAIKNTLDKYTDDIRIKWSNDIYWKDKKICGILIENGLIENKIDYSILGIGLNINQDTFLSDAPNPTSLKFINGIEYSLSEILEELRENIRELYQSLKNGERAKIVSDYKAALYRKNGFHFYEDENGKFHAQINDISSNGLLQLELKNGKSRSYAFKEIKFVI